MSFQALVCKGMFGDKYYDCRLKVTPFRARSLRLVPFTNQTTYQDSISLEVGGHDYMEGLYFYFILVNLLLFYLSTCKSRQGSCYLLNSIKM